MREDAAVSELVVGRSEFERLAEVLQPLRFVRGKLLDWQFPDVAHVLFRRLASGSEFLGGSKIPEVRPSCVGMMNRLRHLCLFTVPVTLLIVKVSSQPLQSAIIQAVRFLAGALRRKEILGNLRAPRA